MCIGAPSSPTFAQTPAAFTPRLIEPAAEGVLVRCSPGAAWYPVATLKPGTVLRAESLVEGWIRVDYPEGTQAVVKADEGTLDEAAGKVVLSRRSRLRAFNQSVPVFEESYKAVFDEFLAPGVELKYVGPMKNRAGETAGFIVVAPAGAKGYVSPRDVRDAVAPATKPAEASPPTVDPSRAPVPTARQEDATTTTAPAVATPAGTTAIEPVVQPSAPPSSEPAAQPESGADATGEPMSPASEPELVPVPAPEPKGPSLRQLDRAFEDMMRQPLADSDPQELIEQYTQYADVAEGEGAARPRLEYVETRIQLLRIRQRARDLLPEIQTLEDASRNAADKYRLTIDNLIKNREYKIVGRLFPSTIYDGSRLPRMYRLVSIDPGIKSTLGYVIPVPEMQLEQKVGSVVGILGDGKVEPASMVEIITPTLVDILRPASELPPIDQP